MRQVRKPVFQAMLLNPVRFSGRLVNKTLSRHFTDNANKMRFVQFKYKTAKNTHVGVETEENGQIIDLVELGVDNLIDFMKGGQELARKAERCMILHCSCLAKKIQKYLSDPEYIKNLQIPGSPEQEHYEQEQQLEALLDLGVFHSK